jgi:glutathione S-transferase
MITLYTLPPAFGQRSPSPFCLKVEMALTHLALDFEPRTTLELNKAPKGKAPWLDDNGIIADSELILCYLDSKTNGGLFGQLTLEEVAIGTAFARLAEDHLYWLIVASRWLDDEWFEVVKRDFFSSLPWPFRTIVPLIARRRIRQTYDLHGLGRHSLQEQRTFLDRDVEALVARLTYHNYIASDRMTIYDFTVASMLASGMDNQPETWVSSRMNQDQSLRDYAERVQEEVGVYGRK